MKYIINKIKTGMALCLTALAFSACNNYLDVAPSTETDKDKLFSNESGFADALSGIYVTMASNDLYGKNLTWRGLDMMGGEGFTIPGFGSGYSYQSFNFNKNSSSYNESVRNNFSDKIWDTSFNAIANVNSALESIDGKKGVFTGSDYNVFKGELLGLRAFLEFDLLRLFAPAFNGEGYTETGTFIPYVKTLTSNVYPLLTNKQVCELALQDLEEAKELLKSDPMYTGADPSSFVCSAVTGNASYREKYGIKSWHNRRFHFNYWAAVATEARIYMWMGDKVNALKCAKEVINAPAGTFTWVAPELVSNISVNSQYVCRDRTFSTEQIFALNITDMDDRTDGYLIEKTIGFNSSSSNLQGFDATAFDAATRPYDYRFQYLRKSYSMYGNDFNLCTKYYKDDDYNNSYSPWSANRLPLIRLSEMYYIAAECEADDNLEQAEKDLETVRQHRGLQAYPLKITSADDLKEQIRLEYHKEFVGEGQTFYYYKRLNENITNKQAYGTVTVTPKVYTMQRPDDEDTYGGRVTLNTTTTSSNNN